MGLLRSRPSGSWPSDATQTNKMKMDNGVQNSSPLEDLIGTKMVGEYVVLNDDPRA